MGRLYKGGIVTPDLFLAHYKDNDSVLFDRHSDIAQIVNLAQEYTDVVSELTARLIAHHKEVGTPQQEWLEAYL